MWVDARGSEILERLECMRLLALRSGGVGHLGFSVDGVPVVLPVNYTLIDSNILVRTGEGVKWMAALDQEVVAFQVDDLDQNRAVAWSVLVRGLVTEIVEPETLKRARVLAAPPLVLLPGTRYLRIRTGLLSGRRFPLRTAPAEVPGSALVMT